MTIQIDIAARIWMFENSHCINDFNLVIFNDVLYIQIIFSYKIFCKFNFYPPNDFKDSVTNFLMHLFPGSMNPIYPLKRLNFLQILYLGY